MPYFISFIPSSPLFSTNQPTSFRPYWALCTTFIRGLHLHSKELACPQLRNPKKQNVAFRNTPCQQKVVNPKTLGSMVIFDENQAVSGINKYEFVYPRYVKIINFLVI
jgi:hypothetical protein